MGMHKMGDKATLVKSFTEEEVRLFTRISGDDNPLHLDPDYAATTPFGRPIVHGLLVSSLFSGLLGAHLPGHGTIYLGQTLAFKAPVFVNEEVEASVEVIAVREDKPIITLKTVCLKSNRTVAVEGEAVVKILTEQGA
jgi:acyl dehydratase